MSENFLKSRGEFLKNNFSKFYLHDKGEICDILNNCFKHRIHTEKGMSGSIIYMYEQQ